MLDVKYLCDGASLTELRRLSRQAYEEFAERSTRPLRTPPSLWLNLIAPKTMAAGLWSLAVRMLDDSIDGDTLGAHEPQWYVDRTTLVLRALEDPERGRDIKPEGANVLLIAAVRHAERCGRPIRDKLERLWRLYVLDVQRQLRGEAFPSRVVQEGVFESNALIQAITIYLKGAPYEASFRIRVKLVKLFDPLENFRNLPEKIIRCQAHIAREVLIEAGLDLEELAACRTWAELAAVPRFARWYRLRLEESRRAWHEYGQDEWWKLQRLSRASRWSWPLRIVLIRKYAKWHFAELEQKYSAALALLPETRG